ncbi:serine/threonine-protein kinase [Gordonia sp. NPDC003585]|uniref:serine/threonine-protein kinase n=1 Tax=Gordonia sp. NPDC003585 TaxID=3154275 RepID=UPI0033B1825C
MPLQPGSTFAGYQILTLLGSGGMGQVFLVEHPHLKRRQALKAISGAGQGNPDFERRFTTEAQTAAALSHPGIITIHDFGITESTPWFTMEYLAGQDLSGQGLSKAEVLRVITDVAAALDFAHRNGVIHRDIKPANIMTPRNPDTGTIERVVVLDFGIAKLAEARSATPPKPVGPLRRASPASPLPRASAPTRRRPV